MNGYALIHILLFVVYTGLFLWLIFRLRFFDIPGLKKTHLSFFFFLKVASGLLLTLIYTYYYTDAEKADIHRYFKDSKIISSLLFTHPKAWLHIITGVGIGQADVYQYLLATQHFSHSSADLATSNAFLIRIVSLLNYLSFSNIYINTLFFNFLSFIGLVCLFKALRNFFSDFAQLLYVPLFLLPSVIFWGSGLLKEALLLFAIGLYVHSFLQWWHSGKKLNVLWVLLALLMVAWLKLYIAVLLVLCSVFLPVPVGLWRRVTVLSVCVIVAWFAVGHGFCERIIEKRNEFIALAATEQAGSVTDTQLLSPDCSTLVSTVPNGLVNAVLRPFVWEGGKVFQLAFAAENILLILYCGFLLFHFFRWPVGDKRWLAAFCILFALLNYMVIGVTIPVMGAIVHYRVIALLFLLLGIACFVDLEKIKYTKPFNKI